jgi:tRNA nucleotidyltransferase (CCA-adding enzyme)
MTHTSEPPRIVDDLMTDDLITVEATDSIGQARDLILALGLNALPVLRDDKVIGILTSPDLADDWAEDLPVTTAMSSPVYRIHPEATLRAAADQMLSFNVHHLIVEDRTRVGIITSFDLLRALSSMSAE